MTTIQWTNEVWNPVRGCTVVSEGCRHCYAMKQAHRFSGPGKPYEGLTELRDQGPWWTGRIKLAHDVLMKPLRWRKTRRVFVNSMSDLFHESVSKEFILAVWAIMEASPQHTYQILSKRPERMRSFLAGSVGQSVEIQQPMYERREIPGYPGYFADTHGGIWSSRRGGMKQLKPCVETKQGHSHVSLHGGSGVFRQEKIHRLILMTFDRLPMDGEEACHKNGVPSLNWISNLRWGTKGENSTDRTLHGNAVTRPILSMRDVADLRIAALQGMSDRDLGRQFNISHTQAARIVHGESWPLRVLTNCWLGVSVEDQKTADERIPILLQVPAAVRFVSVEPLLGPVDLCRGGFSFLERLKSPPGKQYEKVDWIIVGGESGPKARPCDLAWIRSIVQQCKSSSVPCFVKQLGARPYEDGCAPRHVWIGKNPASLHQLSDKKGGNPEEWPEDLRVREWPK